MENTKIPFFARYLEDQSLTVKSGVKSGIICAAKYRSRRSLSINEQLVSTIKPVTMKYPSDDDEAVTLKFPSDSDETSE